MVVRSPQLRWTRGFCIGLGAAGRLVGCVAEKLAYEMLVMHFTYGRAAAYVHLRVVCAVVLACLNVDARASPAVGSCLGIATVRAVGLKLNGGRVCAW